jgi:hypothetical protein
MDFDFDGFDNAEDSEKLQAIKEAISNGAESIYADIKIHSIELQRSEEGGEQT